MDGQQSVLWHYKTRLISNYQNKLLYNIFTKGVIPETGTLTVVDSNGDVSVQGSQVKIPLGFSFFISPNNRNASNSVIKTNFASLSTLEQSILEKQILKCDVIKDFYVIPSSDLSGLLGGYLIAEFNYLEFSDLPVEFSIVATKPIDNRVILGYVNKSGAYIGSIDINEQDISELSSNIPYEMNVDRVGGYHAGNASGTIPISNGSMCSGLNTEMVNGYSGYQVAEKWQSNSGLNVEYISDEFSIFHQPGNSLGNIPLSNTVMNVNLNSEFLGSSGYTVLAKSNHIHSLDYITDGPSFKKPLEVNVSHHLTNDSFKDGAFTKEKIGDECFFARNDDTGGKPTIITGQVTLTANYSTIAFTPKHPANEIFAYPPDIMLQVIDTVDGYSEWDYVKLKAVDVSRTHFTIEYTGYSGANTAQYTQVANRDLNVQFVALGYGIINTNPNQLSNSI